MDEAKPYEMASHVCVFCKHGETHPNCPGVGCVGLYECLERMHIEKCTLTTVDENGKSKTRALSSFRTTFQSLFHAPTKAHVDTAGLQYVDHVKDA